MKQTIASFLGAFLGGTLLLATAPASAAEGVPEAADDPMLETVVVTGSRIAYSPTDGPQPLTVVTRDDIDASGLLSIGDLIQRLPVQGSGVNRTYNNGGDGSIRVELRALGSARTLVLVNGKRWVASGEGANSSIDLNTIPMAAIERIEVLKDGASAAVYGSDAIAGVVNIILRKNVEGIEFSHQDRRVCRERRRRRDDMERPRRRRFGSGPVNDRSQSHHYRRPVERRPPTDGREAGRRRQLRHAPGQVRLRRCGRGLWQLHTERRPSGDGPQSLPRVDQPRRPVQLQP